VRIPSDSRLAPWRFVEFAVFKTWTDRNSGETVEAVVRDKIKKFRGDEGVPRFLEWGPEVREHRDKHNNCGIYTTVFRYGEPNIDASRLGSLYFDLDHEEDPQRSRSDAYTLYSYLSQYVPGEDIRLYFTGSKGFHVEVEAITLGVDPSNNLHNTYRFIAENLRDELDLTTLDFSVYDPRRMWRLPNSQHQKTGLYKVELKLGPTGSMDRIMKFAEQPQPQLNGWPKFNVKANEWYKGWVSAYETQREEERADIAARRAELFNKYGTSIAGGHSQGYVDAVWRSVIKTLQGTTLNRNMELSKQGYKLYLTMLEAQMPLEDVTIALHDVARDIGLEERETTATLKSARRAAKKKHGENPRGPYG